jgi:hypothetical protein
MICIAARADCMARLASSLPKPDITPCSVMQLALVFLSLPGRVLGSEIRPRRFK